MSNGSYKSSDQRYKESRDKIDKIFDKLSSSRVKRAIMRENMPQSEECLENFIELSKKSQGKQDGRLKEYIHKAVACMDLNFYTHFISTN